MHIMKILTVAHPIATLQDEPPRVEVREWRLRPFNYDNTINAMLTLFVVTTGEGWPGIRQNSMDTTEEDQGPSPFFRVEVGVFILYIPTWHV
uniref:Ion transport domain-containing protein n=1 Tax=Parascaris equorum TaxID=6256 RepID=A0A914R5H6_PAREQ